MCDECVYTPTEELLEQREYRVYDTSVEVGVSTPRAMIELTAIDAVAPGSAWRYTVGKQICDLCLEPKSYHALPYWSCKTFIPLPEVDYL